jgi:predicted transcriptional regulator
MEATFVLKPDELTPEWLDQLKSHFADTGIITIKASALENSLSVEKQRISTQQELLKRMQALRERTSRVPVTLPPGIDINDIIDSVNDI